MLNILFTKPASVSFSALSVTTTCSKTMDVVVERMCKRNTFFCSS